MGEAVLGMPTVEMFSAELRNVFSHTASGQAAARGLINLQQRERRVADYFRTINAESKRNSSSLYDAIYHGLSDKAKDELTA